MKKILLVALFTLNMQPLTFAQEALSKGEKEYTFIGLEYEPFNWTDGGTHKGGMLEVVKNVCNKMKIKCKFEFIPMKRVIKMLEDGSTDGVLSLIPNSDREAFATLSVPIIRSNISYFAVKGTFKKIKKLEDLNGATVGALAASSAEKIALTHKEQIKDLKVENESELPTVVNKLTAGRYGAKGLAISNEDVFTTLFKKLNIDTLEVVYVASVDGFSVAFSKKASDPSFIRKFNANILEMKKTGELENLLKPYGLKPAR